MFLRKILGLILVLLGIIIVFTPFTPGSAILIVGLSLLGFNVTFWERIKEKIVIRRK